MIIISKPMITKSKHHICPFHKKNPFKQYAGCTCHSEYWNEVDKDNKVSSLKEEFDLWEGLSDEIDLDKVPQ